jgi:predicted transcriptional regulator
MPQTTDQQLQYYLAQLNEAEKKSLLQMLQTFLTGRKETVERISIEQYNREIEEAEAEYDRGEYITHEEMVKRLKQW